MISSHNNLIFVDFELKIDIVLLVFTEDNVEKLTLEAILKFFVQTIFYILVVSILGSCSSGSFINTKPISMSQKPTSIVVLQIAGLGVTHLGALRFAVENDQDIDVLQSYTCTGISYPQNFYSMRLSALDSMNAQILGSKSINRSCQDYELTPFWERIQAKQKNVVMLEIESDGQNSLEEKKDCSGKQFVKDMVLFKMSSVSTSEKKRFSSKDKGEKSIGVYYDFNCNKEKCSSTAEENIRYVMENFFAKNKNTVFVIRDFKYKKLIEQKKFRDAFVYLRSLINSLNSEDWAISKPQNILTLVVGSDSRELEFPNTSKGWNDMIKYGKGRLFQYGGLQNLVIAGGASSENFCGTYFESELVSKMFFHVLRKSSITDFFSEFNL